MEILSLIISFIAIMVSIWVAISVRQREEVAFEGTLQTLYNQIFRSMDKRYRIEEWVPPKTDPVIWEPLEAYWYFCFDEYERTAKSPKGAFHKLWKQKFRKRVAAGLSHKPLRYVLFNIVQNRGMCSGYADDFLNEMKDIYGSDFIKEFITRGIIKSCGRRKFENEVQYAKIKHNKNLIYRRHTAHERFYQKLH